jgi:hypothetical protein
MHRRSWLGLGALIVGSTLIGCAAPWAVVVQAAPDPFLGQRRFAVLPIDYAGLMIGRKPEPVYLSEKEPKQQASFLEDKAGLNEKFIERLMTKGHEVGLEFVPATGPADAPFLIRPSIAFLEPGFFAAVVSAPSEVHMNVKITTPDGRLLDEINLVHRTAAGFITAASGTRLRMDGDGLGAIVARYIHARTGE